MDTKNSIITKGNQLLEARENSLRSAEVGSLRSHGKLWGMDVFSWNKPSIYELENTLSSFPAPICWFSNSEDIQKLLSEETYWMSNVKLLCAYDLAGFRLPANIFDSIDSVLGTNNIEDALELLPALKKRNGILLFTSSGENWHVAKNKFETFLELNQNNNI
jgi:hypothetical protein